MRRGEKNQDPSWLRGECRNPQNDGEGSLQRQLLVGVEGIPSQIKEEKRGGISPVKTWEQ